MRRLDAVLMVVGLSLVLGGTAQAALVLGTGTGALLGGDLTDPENDGQPDADVGYNVIFSSTNEPGFGAGQLSFNVFDNQVANGNEKWCCDGVDADGHQLTVQLTTPQPYILTHFTMASSGDSPLRDPTVWEIRGSNDGINFDTIFRQDAPTALWTARSQVIRFDGDGVDFPMPKPYSYFQYDVTQTGGTEHALNEIEYFGIPGGEMLYWAGGAAGDWGTGPWVTEAGDPAPDPGYPKVDPDTRTYHWAIVDQPTTLTVDAGHSAVALDLNQGQLQVGTGNSLTITGSLSALAGTQVTLQGGSQLIAGNVMAPAGTQITLLPGSQLTAGSANVDFIQMQNNSQFSIDNGTITRVTVDSAATATVSTGGSLTVNQIIMPPAGTFVKGGSGELTLEEITASAGTTVRIDGGVMAAIGGLGSAKDLVLNGGEFKLSGNPQIMPNELDYAFYKDAPESEILAIDDGLPNAQNGGLFSLVPTSSSTWTGEVWQAGNIDDQYSQMWSGLVTAPVTGEYEIYIHGDDYETVWIDLNRNGEFEATAGELISNNTTPEGWNTPHTEYANLEQGKTYNFAIAHREGTGGDWVNVEIGIPGDPGGRGRINPSDPAQAGIWSAMGEAAIDSDIEVTVTNDSVLNLISSGDANLGALTLTQGTLSITGTVDRVTFPSTSIDVVDGARVGLAPQVPVDFGTVSGAIAKANPAVSSFTFSKGGPATWIVVPGDLQDMDKATIDSSEGTLRMVGTGSWAGAHAISLSGGRMAISDGLGVAGSGQVSANRTGLIGEWTFDSGTGVDTSPLGAESGNHAVLYGAASIDSAEPVPGLAGPYLDLSGGDGYAVVDTVIGRF
ncbi:MAG TPA: PA14 domain-containing protein, partial [Thermoguttaceae bacterium]|nr:PA14 domain-containing protein [Thermoguttaceae bacterium]